LLKYTIKAYTGRIDCRVVFYYVNTSVVENDLEDVLKARKFRREQRGINLISVIIATVIMSIAGLAILAALSTAFKGTRSSEPKEVGQTTVTNFQTDLNAMAMYDPNVISHISAGRTISIAHSAAPQGVTLPPSDTLPTKITVQTVTGSGSTGQVAVNYVVPNDTLGTAAITGNSIVTLTQKSPNGCDPKLSGQILSNGTVCP